jgi:dipeptidyl aminopeptidase/acylaminoacyl peptidase
VNIKAGQWKAWDRYHRKCHPDPKKCSIMISFVQKVLIRERFSEKPHLFLEASPVFHAHGEIAKLPFLLIHGNRDIVVPFKESQ